MSTPPAPMPAAPRWPHCAHGADPAIDPVGCPGIHVSGHTVCLAHLSDTDRNTYLASLAPGAYVDHRGTPFTEPLLASLLQALRDPTTQDPHLGSAWFDKALITTLNSVVFRSSGQDLTTAGTYIEMTSRLLEPTLLALAALAVRGRIKR
ncbi:hypothetical protein ACWCQL_13190 [Streptomyces sp. NPDC002073]